MKKVFLSLSCVDSESLTFPNFAWVEVDEDSLNRLKSTTEDVSASVMEHGVVSLPIAEFECFEWHGELADVESVKQEDVDVWDMEHTLRAKVFPKYINFVFQMKHVDDTGICVSGDITLDELIS